MSMQCKSSWLVLTGVIVFLACLFDQTECLEQCWCSYDHPSDHKVIELSCHVYHITKSDLVLPIYRLNRLKPSVKRYVETNWQQRRQASLFLIMIWKSKIEGRIQCQVESPSLSMPDHNWTNSSPMESWQHEKNLPYSPWPRWSYLPMNEACANLPSGVTNSHKSLLSALFSILIWMCLLKSQAIQSNPYIFQTTT
jgi:hypothetical protein